VVSGGRSFTNVSIPYAEIYVFDVEGPTVTPIGLNPQEIMTTLPWGPLYAHGSVTVANGTIVLVAGGIGSAEQLNPAIGCLNFTGYVPGSAIGATFCSPPSATLAPPRSYPATASSGTEGRDIAAHTLGRTVWYLRWWYAQRDCSEPLNRHLLRMTFFASIL
jgi:hypothetical protein